MTTTDSSRARTTLACLLTPEDINHRIEVDGVTRVLVALRGVMGDEIGIKTAREDGSIRESWLHIDTEVTVDPEDEEDDEADSATMAVSIRMAVDELRLMLRKNLPICEPEPGYEQTFVGVSLHEQMVKTHRELRSLSMALEEFIDEKRS